MNFDTLELRKFFLKKRLEALDAIRECLREYSIIDDRDRKDHLKSDAKMWGRWSLEAKEKLTKL